MARAVKLAALLSTTFISTFAQQAAFDWTSIQASNNLTWINCYSSVTQCARLSVPYNYSDPQSQSATLALIRIPSSLADTPGYRGPVLFNPGGPGESGINFVLNAGELVSGVLGPAFDLVSFDPRGIGHSTPKISFFATDTERALWNFGPDGSDVTAAPDSISRQWAQAQVLGKLAQDRDPTGFLDHVSTDNVARDMLRITELHGRDKLQYWGISYGTVLGATFATMFPDRIERLVIDGVMDVENYYKTDWANEIKDTEKALQTFYDGCHAAGPQACAFYADSSAKIKSNLDDLFKKVQQQPVSVFSSTSGSYGVLDYVGLKNAVFSSLYSPYNRFSTLAKGLALLASTGDASALYQISLTAHTNEVVMAVACGDGAKVNDDPAALTKYYNNIKDSSLFSSIIAVIRVTCSGWRAHPQKLNPTIGGKTSFPLLVIGNTADPVTPLWAAQKTAKAFPGAVVLTQDSPGHTSFTSPTPCTLNAVAQYFVNGTLPAAGVVCPVSAPLFPSATPAPAGNVTARAIHLSMSEIARRLSERFIVPPLV